MSVKSKIEGISGADNICVLQPYEILEIKEKEPIPLPPEKPETDPEELLSLFQRFLELLRKIFKI